MNHPPAITGRNFIAMMRPILGLEGAPGIREIRITAQYDQAAIIEVGMVAHPDFDRVTVEHEDAGEPEIRTRRYTVTVTEVTE